MTFGEMVALFATRAGLRKVQGVAAGAAADLATSDQRSLARFARERSIFGESAVAETPTITLDKASGTSGLTTTVPATLSGGTVVNTTNFRWLSPGAIPRSSNTLFVELRSAHTGLVTTGIMTLASGVIEFMTDAPHFDIMQFGGFGNSAFTVEIDGKIAVRSPNITNTNTRYHEFDFTAATMPRRARRVRIFGYKSFMFGGLKVGPNDTVWQTPRRPLALVFGDSYTAADGGDGYYTWGNVLGRAMGWDVMNSGVGSTGYLANNSGNSLNFIDRMDADLTAFHPDVAVIAGGINDIPGYLTNTWTQDQLTAAAVATWTKVLNDNPNAIVIVMGPWRGSSGNGGSYTSVDMCNSFKAAAQALPLHRKRLFYIPTNSDPSGPWQYGSLSSGNFQIYGSGDGTHMIEAGQFYLGQRAAVAVAAELAFAA